MSVSGLGIFALQQGEGSVWDLFPRQVLRSLAPGITIECSHFCGDSTFCVCVVNNVEMHVIVVVAFSIDERMDELTRFIDYHYKSIVSTIRARHVLTLHLSTAN